MSKTKQLDRVLGSEYSSKEDRIQFLRANCDAVEELSYMKQFSEEKLTDMKNDLSVNAILINDILEEKKDAMSDFKDRLKPLAVWKKELLTNIKQKAVLVEEKCFKFVDQEIGRTGLYNEDGLLVSDRPISPSERQKTIFQIEKTGSND